MIPLYHVCHVMSAPCIMYVMSCLPLVSCMLCHVCPLYHITCHVCLLYYVYYVMSAPCIMYIISCLPPVSYMLCHVCPLFHICHVCPLYYVMSAPCIMYIMSTLCDEFRNTSKLEQIIFLSHLYI